MPSHSTSPSQGGSPAPGPWAAPKQHWSRGPARLSEATGHEAKWIVHEQRAGDCGREGPGGAAGRSGSCRGRTGPDAGEPEGRAGRASGGLFRSESLRGLAGYGADTAGEESESAAARDSREPQQGAGTARRRAVPPRARSGSGCRSRSEGGSTGVDRRAAHHESRTLAPRGLARSGWDCPPGPGPKAGRGAGPQSEFSLSFPSETP